MSQWRTFLQIRPIIDKDQPNFFTLKAFGDKGPMIFTDKAFFTDKGLTHVSSSTSISRPSHISHYPLTSPSHVTSSISCTLCPCILYYRITSHTLSSPASYGRSAIRFSLVNHSQPPSFCDPATHPLHLPSPCRRRAVMTDHSQSARTGCAANQPRAVSFSLFHHEHSYHTETYIVAWWPA